jgi:hypothetical protein
MQLAHHALKLPKAYLNVIPAAGYTTCPSNNTSLTFQFPLVEDKVDKFLNFGFEGTSST